ncbi:MAG: SAM-dependent methyltransferase [Pseudomonadota bacterium]
MSVADYMTTCLHHPEHGYYATRDPIGADGDFVTAPEISQMFGEVLGLALAQTWMDQGAPDRILLAELGPGNGTLMADVLRATATVPGFHAAADIALVESSRVMRERQRRALPGHAPRFCDTVQDLPDAPLFLVGNEFFDALPIRIFQRSISGWDEWRVGAADGALQIGLRPAELVPDLSKAPGNYTEICPAAEAIASEIGTRIAQFGGAAFIIDYGELESREVTFQAVHKHQKVDPLAHPGQADLTAHVAFGPLLRAARPAQGFGPVEQGTFLARLGLHQRADQLATRLTGDALNQHRAAEKRLTTPGEMGTLFKVIGLAPAGAADLPGLERA